MRKRNVKKQTSSKAVSTGVSTIDNPEEAESNHNNNKTFFETPYEFDSAIQHLALFRMLFFSLMCYEWYDPGVLMPFGWLKTDFDPTTKAFGKDGWFCSHHLEWVQGLHVALGSHSLLRNLCYHGGFALMLLAAFGIELRLPVSWWRWFAAAAASLYSMQFFSKATNHQNHHVFPLIMILLIYSGGGNISGRRAFPCGKTVTTPRHGCEEAAIVALRTQIFSLFFHSLIWKLNEDWVLGRIARNVLLSLEESGKTQNIPWKVLDTSFPNMWKIIGIGGLFLDAGMAALYLFFKPSPRNTKYFVSCTFIFHALATVAMAPLTGYIFPGVCTAGVVLFLPLRKEHYSSKNKNKVVDVMYYDQTTLGWIWEYVQSCLAEMGGASIARKKTSLSGNHVSVAGQANKRFAMFWILWQVLSPVRMLVVSDGNFPYNRLGFRNSWVVLHSLRSGFTRKNKRALDTYLTLFYYVPTCFLRGGTSDRFLPREVYLGQSDDLKMQDNRTVPLQKILNMQESKMIETFPIHLLSRVGAGVASAIDRMLNGGDEVDEYNGGCSKLTSIPDYSRPEKTRMGMHAVFFGQLNGNGPFCRIVDPTVDLVSTEEGHKKQLYPITLLNAILDKRPHGNEFLLRQGIGSSRALAKRREEELRKLHPDAQIHFIADRAACLAGRPLWLVPMGFPMKFEATDIPKGAELKLQYTKDGHVDMNEQTKTKFVGLGETVRVVSTHIEVSVTGYVNEFSPDCAETVKEDVLIAIYF